MAQFDKFSLYSMNVNIGLMDEKKVLDGCDSFLNEIKKGGNYCRVTNLKNSILANNKNLNDSIVMINENYYEFDNGNKTLEFEYKGNSLRVIARKNGNEFYSNEYIYDENDIEFFGTEKDGNKKLINNKKGIKTCL